MAQTMIQYVGNKPAKKDNVAGTGVTWGGKGDVKAVPAAAAAALLRFPDVWRLAEAGEYSLAAAQPVRASEPAANPLLGLTVLQLLEIATIEPAEAVRQLREAGHIPAPSLAGMHLADLLEGAGIAPSEALQMLQKACGGDAPAQQRAPQDGASEQPSEDGAVPAGDTGAKPPVIDLGTDLSKFEDEVLRDAIRAQKLGIDCRKRGDALRVAITEALKVKG